MHTVLYIIMKYYVQYNEVSGWRQPCNWGVLYSLYTTAYRRLSIVARTIENQLHLPAGSTAIKGIFFSILFLLNPLSRQVVYYDRLGRCDELVQVC